jgi:hypothetical protein
VTQKKGSKHERITNLYPRAVLDQHVLVEGDRCPMRKSKVEGRAGREIRLDGLCSAKANERKDCQYHRGVGPKATFGRASRAPGVTPRCRSSTAEAKASHEPDT